MTHGHRSGTTRDDAAVERYRHLLCAAPPAHLEEAHADAFAGMTPARRRHVLTSLVRGAPSGERGAACDPRTLARLAVRAEVRRPGTLARVLGDGGLLDLGPDGPFGR
jgi:hypothetical protein